MTTLEQAARDGLDALENMLAHADALVNSKVLGPHFYHHDRAKSRRAIDALRAALAQQQVEPVNADPQAVREAQQRAQLDLRLAGRKKNASAGTEFGVPHFAEAEAQQAEPVQAEPLTWLLINKTGARPLIYGDAALAKQAEPVVWDPQCPLCGGSRQAALAQQAEPVADSGNPSY
jgi:hypothetical protein